MNVIISPAKRMRAESDLMEADGLPHFLPEADRLRSELAGYTRDRLQSLFKANDAITDLNFERYRHMELTRGLTPAVLSYVGLQYQSMAPEVFETAEWEYVRNHLKILSGLYGLLNACDGVVPYRLEMQAKLSVDGCPDLYGYWSRKLYDRLAAQDPVILNLASKEYSRAVEPYLEGPVRYITCVFGSFVGGRLKTRAAAAKMARGDLVRWLARHRVQDPEDVKRYRGLGYRYCPERSDCQIYVFVAEN